MAGSKGRRSQCHLTSTVLIHTGVSGALTLPVFQSLHLYTLQLNIADSLWEKCQKRHFSPLRLKRTWHSEVQSSLFLVISDHQEKATLRTFTQLH